MDSNFTSGKIIFQNEGGYRDGLKHQKGRNKGSLRMRLTDAELAANGVVQGRAQRSTVVTCGKKQTIT